MKTVALVSSLVILAAGCATDPSKYGNIIAFKQRTLGLKLGQSTINQTPEIQFGLITTVFQLIPTDTNTLHSPRYFDTYDMKSTWGTGIGVTENTGAGEVMTGTNGYGKALFELKQNQSNTNLWFGWQVQEPTWITNYSIK